MIEFRVGNGWTEEHVAIRLAQIVTGHARKRDDELTPYDIEHRIDNPPWKVPKNGSSYKWQLDIGNDWFLRKVEGIDNRYSLGYRYGHSPERQKMLDDIVPFLEFIFFYHEDLDKNKKR